MNRQIKNVFTLACMTVLLSIGQASAQTLVLHHADGTTTDVQLYTRPQVRFQNDKVIITSNVLNMEYPKEDVLRFTYKGESMGIANPTEKANVSEEDGQLVFHGIRETDKIAVYKTNGIRVPISVNRSDNTVILPLNAIPSGVYFLNVNGKNSKFVKP